MGETVAVHSTLFYWSFLAATILPLGSEPALFALVMRGHSLWTETAVATAGNVLGACTTYWLGRRAAAILQGRGALRQDSTSGSTASERSERATGTERAGAAGE